MATYQNYTSHATVMKYKCWLHVCTQYCFGDYHINLDKCWILVTKSWNYKKKMLLVVNIRMFYIHQDIWSLDFQFSPQKIYIYFNVALTVGRKCCIFVVNGSNSCCCTKCPQLFLLDTKQSLIFTRHL